MRAMARTGQAPPREDPAIKAQALVARLNQKLGVAGGTGLGAALAAATAAATNAAMGKDENGNKRERSSSRSRSPRCVRV